MNLKSNNYPTIEYEKGEEIFLSPEEINSSFYFDVEEELTSNDEAMAIVASMIDEVDTLVEAAKDFLKNTLSNEENEYYGTVAYFMEFHRDEMDADTVLELFPSSNVDTITFIEMVDFLKMIRFGSLIDNKTNQQAFIMDLSFNPELTDELMVIYFNLEKQVFYVTHES
ncbi:hypothetical protein GCWU000282_02582 [Catonella morbi ATCC 51271]|jgi:hypothetical protein|uniref:DUF2004 domain-containing protein n=1 Tax=Catonella morbi ATCC 51271 TaxID=592026 RepID=V2Y416_9FIRM|nr:DUF2004 domain-containing protein [Catonella morbi]ESL02446.1 hypothetical protein GCWU000282_02582 [Catonella morbi ATCC 51271]